MLILLSTCAPIKPVEQPEHVNIQYIEGIVQSTVDNEVVLTLKLPEFKKTPDIPINEIAQQVIQKSLFLEGIKTEINNIPAVIKEVRANTITAVLEKPQAFAAGATLKLQIPRKIIAITDFEVIRGKEKEVGRVTLEGLTSALIDSGHFIVVERSKLRTIINELELSLSGLTKEPPEKLMGKLLTADLILTGTLADIGGAWDINLRLVNVRTGQAMSAIAMRIPLFRPSELRDASAMEEDFESNIVDASWFFGYKKYDKSTYERYIDKNIGAEGSKKSARIDFDFDEDTKPTYAKIENKKKRDVSFYNGIEFFAKATKKLYGTVSILTSLPNNPNRLDDWLGYFVVDTEWKKIRIPFEQLVIARGWFKYVQDYGATIGDQVWRANYIEMVRIGVSSSNNKLPAKGTMWIDKIRFYRD